jgi:hypothetical protein
MALYSVEVKTGNCGDQTQAVGTAVTACRCPLFDAPSAVNNCSLPWALSHAAAFAIKLVSSLRATEIASLQERSLATTSSPHSSVRIELLAPHAQPQERILGFLDRSRYFFFQVAPQLYSRGWVDLVPDPLLLRNSGSAGNRTRDLWICSQWLWPLDHRDGQFFLNSI